MYNKSSIIKPAKIIYYTYYKNTILQSIFFMRQYTLKMLRNMTKQFEINLKE